MRLGLHYHVPACYRDGVIRAPAFLGLFIDSLTAHCESLLYFANSPVGDEMNMMDYVIKSPNVKLVDLGPHVSIPVRTVRAAFHVPSLLKSQVEVDLLLLRAPTPLLPLFYAVWRKPTALLLVSDELAGIENLPQPAWRKATIRLWAQWNHRLQMRLSKQSLVFVNSQLLYENYRAQLPGMILTQTTTLRESDFYYREDTCISSPYRLLYAGRITRIKGIFEIVRALSNLVKDGFDVVLDLVGMLDNSDPILEPILELARSLDVDGRVQYHGYKTAGPELLEYYRRADIYVTASQSSNEGFPRTIWEAMASSTPVIATGVGSIPAFVSGAAVLVPPKDIDALTGALRSLITDKELRRCLVSRGLALAKSNTLEKRAEELITKMEAWLAGEKS